MERSSSIKKGIAIFILIIIGVGAGICIKTFAPRVAAGTYAQKIHSYKGKGIRTPDPFSIGNQKYIARIDITGTIAAAGTTYNQEWLLNTIAELKSDDNNVGILLYIDSPGGSVYESDEAYLTLMDYKRSGKSIYAYLGPIAASGGYYIACAADYIIANRNTLTGSIGVIAGESMDVTELLEKIGVRYTTITAGANKNMGNVNEPLSDEQRRIYQSIADECYEQFTGIVASSRHLPLNTVYTLADGRIYTAKQAKEAGLIDSVGTFDDAFNRMISHDLIDDEYALVTYSYQLEEPLFRELIGIFSSITKLRAHGSRRRLFLKI